MDVFKGHWEERHSLTWDQFLSCTAHFHTHVTDSLAFVNITLHTYHNGDRLVFLSFHPLTVTSYSSHVKKIKKMLDVSLWCLLLPPVSQSAFQQELHFSQPWPLPHRKLPGISPPLLMSFFDKEKGKILQCHFCVTRHLCVEKTSKGKKRSDNVVHEVLDSTPGYLKSYDLYMDPTPPQVNPPRGDTWWHFTGTTR